MLEQIAKEMARIGPRVANATTRSDIALFYDYPNSWAQGSGGVGDPHPSYGEVQRFYTGLKVLGQNIDVVPVTTELAGYKVVAAPNIRLIDDATIERLKRLSTPAEHWYSTTAPPRRIWITACGSRFRRDRSPKLRGCNPRRFSTYLNTTRRTGISMRIFRTGLGIRFAGSEATFSPRTALESLTLHGAEAIATIRGGGSMEGGPAVTRNRHGRGWVIYVGCDATSDDFYEAVAHVAGTASGLTPLIQVALWSGSDEPARTANDLLFPPEPDGNSSREHCAAKAHGRCDSAINMESHKCR